MQKECHKLVYLRSIVAAIRVDPHGDPGVLGGAVDPVVDVVTCAAGC